MMRLLLYFLERFQSWNWVLGVNLRNFEIAIGVRQVWDFYDYGIRFLLSVLFLDCTRVIIRFRSKLPAQDKLILSPLPNKINFSDPFKRLSHLSHRLGNRSLGNYISFYMRYNNGTLLFYEYFTGGTKRDGACF